MYKIRIRNFEKKNLIDELIQVFLRPSEYEITDGADDAASGDEILTFNGDGNLDRDGIKREVYEKLSRITGLKPEWGILTGIRPVKLCSELFDRTGNLDEVKRIFRARFSDKNYIMFKTIFRSDFRITYCDTMVYCVYFRNRCNAVF